MRRLLPLVLVGCLALASGRAVASPGRPVVVTDAVGAAGTVGGETLSQLSGVELTGVACDDPAAQVLDVQDNRVTMGFQSGVVAPPRLRDGA